MKTILHSIFYTDFKKNILDNGFKKFRIGQIFHWVLQKRVFDFSKMKNIPNKLINYLQDNYYIVPFKLKDRIESVDNSIKYSFETIDNYVVEVVLIRTEKRNTLCISSQIGCAVGCKFCLTGKMGIKRDLSVDEIIFQLLLVEQIENIKITNIVYMGMGEPLLNYDNIVESLRIFTKELEISRRKIVISTVGIVDKIYKLSELEYAPKLAISLHSADKSVREDIIPISNSSSLDEILEAVYYYFQMTQLPITYEYVLLEGVNNRDKDIELLKDFVSKVRRSKINLISFNEYDGAIFKRATNVLEFQEELKKEFPIFLRTSAGQDISAACGNLYSKNEEEK